MAKTNKRRMIEAREHVMEKLNEVLRTACVPVEIAEYLESIIDADRLEMPEDVPEDRKREVAAFVIGAVYGLTGGK